MSSPIRTWAWRAGTSSSRRSTPRVPSQVHHHRRRDRRRHWSLSRPPAPSTTRRRPIPRAPRPSPRGPFKTLKVCKAKKSCFPTIQSAVNRAKPGDTVKVAHGTYREGVKISGASKRYIKLIGDPKAPSKVVLEGKGIKKANGVADQRCGQRHRQRLHRPALQRQRLLRRQHEELHLHQPEGVPRRRVRHLRLQLGRRHDDRLRGRVEQRLRASTSGRRRRRPSRSARSSGTSRPTATSWAGRGRTCAT